jgi:phosphopantothenoylcysteine decarboxylase/phosphopantothenate--cysteine ligase
MRVIVTCGPSYEPIDEVRRLTNFSTGQLGVLLANQLAHAGHEVLCLKGASASCNEVFDGPAHLPFTTNDDLRAQLASQSASGQVDAVFHAAALCDFRVKSIVSATGGAAGDAKISSRAGELTLTLEPTSKLIADLRALFPQSRVVGWKYELNGTRDDALRQATRQLEENATDLCVLNGAAYGAGFGLCRNALPLEHCQTKTELCTWLAEWLAARLA